MKHCARPTSSAKTTRPPLERMLRIHHALQTDEYPNCSTLARELEVSVKTVQRDLEFMRDRLNLPLAFFPKVRGYRYTAAVDHFPTVEVTEGEVVALLVAQKVMAQYRGTPFEEPLTKAFEKITLGLRSSIHFPLVAMEKAISFKSSGTAPMNLEDFRLLYRSVVERRELCFGYKKRGESNLERRTVQPYFIHGALNGWYLVGFDREREAFRTFSIQRMREIQMSGAQFERCKEGTPETLLKSSLGVYFGDGSYRVQIRFDPFAAELVRERNWHVSQELQELADGALDLSMTLSSLFEVEQWVLGWGRHAEVIEPPELREMVRDHVSALSRIYKDC